MNNLDKHLNEIHYIVPEERWGKAISYTYEKEDGTMWVGNREYESRVNYCPITGKPAIKQMNLLEEIEISKDITSKLYE